jgi:hypothetical protein
MDTYKIRIVKETDGPWSVVITDPEENAVMEMECVSERDARVTAALLKGKTLS